jgi:hypothetical protein
MATRVGGHGSSDPANSRPGQENGRCTQLYRDLGEQPGASISSGGEWGVGAPAAALLARW